MAVPAATQALLDENVDSLRELSANVESVREDVDALGSFAEDVSSRVEESATTAVEAMNTLNAALTTLRVGVDDAQEKAALQIAAVQTHLATVEGQVEAAGNRVVETMAELDDRAEASRNAVDAFVHRIEAEFNETTALAIQLRAGIEQMLTQTNGVVDGFESGVNAAVEELRTDTEAVEDEFGDIQSVTSERLRDLMRDFSSAADETSSQLTRTLDVIASDAGASVAHVKERLLKDALRQLETASDELEQSLDKVQEVITSGRGEIERDMAELEREVDNVTGVLRRIQPALNRAASV